MACACYCYKLFGTILSLAQVGCIMANKFLRRFITRSGLSFFPSRGPLDQASCATASSAELQSMQELCLPNSSDWNNTHGAPTIPSSVPASCLPFYGRLPSSSAVEDAYYLSATDEEEEEKQLSRCHSCSKLHNRRSDQSCKLRDLRVDSGSSSATDTSKHYSRSWSAPSLHKRRRMIKLPHKARSFSSSGRTEDSACKSRTAPKGHVAVYVDAGKKRHVVPIAYLSHPRFHVLLKRAESEFGFRQQGPGLRIPCSLSELLDTLHQIQACEPRQFTCLSLPLVKWHLDDHGISVA